MIISAPYSVPLKCCSWWLNSPGRYSQRLFPQPVAKKMAGARNERSKHVERKCRVRSYRWLLRRQREAPAAATDMYPELNSDRHRSR